LVLFHNSTIFAKIGKLKVNLLSVFPSPIVQEGIDAAGNEKDYDGYDSSHYILPHA
jgi:hypothetical protein